MANVVQSIGYAVGKVHTGLIRYLCDHWNVGHRKEVEPFFDALGISLAGIRRVVPAVEQKGVDLVIRGELEDTSKPMPIAMVEMKVDDHEHRVNRKDRYQTEVYPEPLGVFQTHLFVTLGAGEFYLPPRNASVFRWVKLAQFADAVLAVSLPDKAVRDWAEALQSELQVRQAAANATALPPNTGDLRSGIWNLNLLGSLKESLKAERLDGDLGEARVYPWGTHPDTILNFGHKSLYYAEINNGGRLSLKASLSSVSSSEEKNKIITRARSHYKSVFGNAGLSPKPGPSGQAKDSKTLMSFDVGLSNDRCHLYFTESCEATRQKVARILRVFYTAPIPVVPVRDSEDGQASDGESR